MARTRRKGGRVAASGAQERLLGTLHQIYLAGLGALSKATTGAPQLFEELVAEGARVHADTRGAAEKALQGVLAGVQERVSAGVGQVRGQAADALDGLEKVFQTRVHRALAQLGVPSAEEVTSLSKRVDTLNDNINRLARTRETPRTRAGAATTRAGGSRMRSGGSKTRSGGPRTRAGGPRTRAGGSRAAAPTAAA